MNRAPFLIFGGFAVVCLLLVFKVVMGQGAESAAPVTVESQDEDGKQLFAEQLRPVPHAGRGGRRRRRRPEPRRGPRARAATPTYEGSYNRALAAITCGFGGGRMPAGIIQGENAQEVAAFVGAYAGQAGSDPSPSSTRTTRKRPRAGPAPESCEAPPSRASQRRLACRGVASMRSHARMSVLPC